MINTILEFIDKYKLENKTVIVAFSGGYDSMCLLDLLNKISGVKKITPVAAHFNHNWRGEEARAEQLHCEEFCKTNGIEFYTETAPSDTPKTETSARDLRYAFLKRAASKYNTDVVFTAHNYDDNAETILYRIIKGTGVVGLQGISAVRDIYYRPLLTVKRSDIEKYCADNGLTPNRDSSNGNTKYKRNFLRLEIIPMLEKINPEIKKSLNNLAEISRSELMISSEYLDKISDELYEDGKLLKSEYNKLSESLKQKIIYNLCYNSGLEYDSVRIQNIYYFLEENLFLDKTSKYSLTNKTWLYIGDRFIEVITSDEKITDEVEIADEGEYKLGNTVFVIQKADKREKTKDECTAYVDLSGVLGLKLRTRRDGDIIYPLGMSGKMKLKKYLINKKIPEHKRDKLVLLACGTEILWVGGVGVSDKIKTTTKPTHKISIKYGEQI